MTYNEIGVRAGLIIRAVMRLAVLAAAVKYLLS